MWTPRKIEERIHQHLLKELGDQEGEAYFAVYQATRDKVAQGVLPEIATAQPDLSDHGVAHIGNVLDNVFYLLDSELEELSGIELYCLSMMVLFHDVGNIYGRTEHHRHLAAVFDWARGTDAAVRREKMIVLRAARAHTGVASDGSSDTLKELAPSDHLAGKEIRLQQLGAILRFADELAEGPQRTSDFRRRQGLYTNDSATYHEYASITHLFIDRGNQRIVLTYEISIEESTGEDARNRWLQELLAFIYWRISKLDAERRYAKYYCDLLAPFKAVHARMNFHFRGQPVDLDLPPLIIDEKALPDSSSIDVQQYNPNYDIASIIRRLAERITAEFGNE